MGLGSFRTTWKRQTKYFGHIRSSQYSSLIFDNRGMGLSGKPSSRYTTTEMARDAIDLFTQLKWLDPSNPQRNLNIIGVSMGGMIAQELALLIPQHIQTLILVSTAPRLVRTVPFIENLRQRINMFVPRDIDVQLDETARRLMSSEFLALPDTDHPDPKLNYPTKRDRFAAGELQKRMDKDGFTRKGFILQAIAAGWHSKSPAQIKDIGDKVDRERICIMHCTGDRMITFHHYKLLEKELGEGVEGKVWEGKGHALLWEVEDEFNKAVEDFIVKRGGLS
jgi:pimeloyl-ACP methyl ester carboxylesterase